ncbi:MAG: hypothetical protein Satyrvirus7_29 [Satyrvirus sp.]|uniref:Uncharacterized protein n=1 Tax=Satyrvirus sp. TaxID=2487771 RepID=A0A3G5ADD3_9VIRU|nr:MAG: hypothetical protein Satyrvirus7_29 [Satyrvirus sp.]
MENSIAEARLKINNINKLLFMLGACCNSSVCNMTTTSTTRIDSKLVNCVYPTFCKNENISITFCEQNCPNDKIVIRYLNSDNSTLLKFSIDDDIEYYKCGSKITFCLKLCSLYHNIIKHQNENKICFCIKDESNFCILDPKFSDF